MILKSDREAWFVEAEPMAERIASALSGLKSKAHIYAALEKLGFQPFRKRTMGSAKGIKPRTDGVFVVKSMYVVDGYSAKFCLPTLVMASGRFEPLLDGHKVSEDYVVLQPLCDNDMRRITPLWEKENSPCDELNDFIEAAPNNIGIWKWRVCLLDW